jgi:hypothetical protein
MILLKILALALLFWLCILGLWIWAAYHHYRFNHHNERDGDFY